MSNKTNDHQGHADDEAAEPLIKTPQQLIKVIVLAFIVPVIVIVLLAGYVTSGKKPNAGSDVMSTQSIEARIRPVARFEIKDASAPQILRTGLEVYNAQCVACHGVGAAGAPKFGDATAWGPRIGQGYPGLLNSALKGKGVMSAQGGGEYSDVEVGRAVVHMANAGGAKFEEPAK
ncbi:MAG: cytochrome c5 family protein [Betaproteobacteria bacterium]|nr:cytochrome c5 family protein [Betaproteobacteria bacterium]